jgi:hypothetical protein
VLHPKYKSLYFDEYTGKWALRHTRGRSQSRCPVPWCKNPPACYYRNGRISYELYCYKCKSRRYRANHPIRYAFEDLKVSAKKRSIQFDLSLSDFEAWCKKTGYADSKGVTRLTHHCDRIRHTEGYNINNIQLLTERENIQKRNRDLAENSEPPDIELDDNCPF